MYSEHPDPPFHKAMVYIGLDLLFVVFSILYLIGDSSHQNNFLKYVKPVPTWIMIYQLWSLRSCHRHMITIILALLFGSIGDIFLLFQSTFIFFALGALAFLIGHILYVLALIPIAEDIAENRTTLRQVLRQQPLFIVMWMVLMAFSFWSISFMVTFLEKGDVMVYVLAIYGSCLVLLTMGGFFFFFTTFHISDTIQKAGLLFMFGSLIFFASDNFLAHGKFDKDYQKVVSDSLGTYLIMITYYAAQFMMAKGGFFVAVHYTESKFPQLTQGNQIFYA